MRPGQAHRYRRRNGERERARVDRFGVRARTLFPNSIIIFSD